MDKASGTVLDFFTTVEDPRQRGKVVYRLDEILLIALDGKTSKRTGDTRTGQRPLHTLSACAREQRLVLAQEVVDGKSNERAMIPSLLDKLRLKGSLVTIDAAGTCRPIAGRIVEAG